MHARNACVLPHHHAYEVTTAGIAMAVISNLSFFLNAEQNTFIIYMLISC